MRDFKAVVFDGWQTVFDSEGIYTVGLLSEFLKTDVEKIEKIFDQYEYDFLTGSLNPSEWIDHISKELDIPLVQEEKHRLLDEVAESWRSKSFLLPGVERSLMTLKKSGYKLALCSDADPFTLGVAREHLGHLLDKEFFSFMAGSLKSDEKILTQTVKTLGVKPEETVYAGDGGGNELSAAKHAGFGLVVFVATKTGYGANHPDDDTLKKADEVVGSINELPKLLLS